MMNEFYFLNYKNNMNLHIHLWTNLEYFDLLNEGFLLSTGKTDREIASFFMQNFPWELAETISPQYEVNFMAIRELKKRFGGEVFQKIDGIYYGSDNCEYLLAYEHEIKKAYEKFGEFNKKFPPHKPRVFTFVTPYVGDVMMEKLQSSLLYLQSVTTSKNPIEVVVNDFWVLHFMKKNCPDLKISFGRIIHKILKTPLIDTFGYEVHPDGEAIKNKSSQDIELLKQNIIKWQLKFYASSEVWVSYYKNFLSQHKISRITLDYMEKREALFSNLPQEAGVDVYYPWAIVFTGRLCDTSSIENPKRGYYAIDEICPRTCNRYDVSYKIKTTGYKLIQRGNAAYRSELNLDYLPEAFFTAQNRVIFSPFIPV